MLENILYITGSCIFGGILGFYLNSKITNKIIYYEMVKKDKFKTYYDLLNQWLDLKNKNVSLESYFMDKGIENIAIYGMGELGHHLYEELKESKIQIKYAIDKSSSKIYSNLKLYDFEDDFENVSAIVVTPTYAFDQIEKKLKEKIDCTILSLEDIINYLKL